MMSSAGGYPPIDTTTPGHAAPIPLVSTIQAVRYGHLTVGRIKCEADKRKTGSGYHV